jgi:hypothetical protein
MQACVSASVPAALGPIVLPYEQCSVVMMVGLPGAAAAQLSQC